MKNQRIRKTICAPLMLCVALIMTGGGVRADDSSRIKLLVKEETARTRSKDKKGDVYKWPYFEIYRDAVIQNCTLNITVSGQNAQETPCQLEWYFISEETPLPEPSTRLIGKSKSHSITETTIPDQAEPFLTVFSPGKDKVMLQDQKPVEKTATAVFEYARILVDKFDNYGDQSIKRHEYYKGDTYVGYIVLLVDDNGNILARTASNTWMLDQKWIEKCRAVRL